MERERERNITNDSFSHRVKKIITIQSGDYYYS